MQQKYKQKMTSWLPDKAAGYEQFRYKQSEGIGQGPYDNYRRIGHFAGAGVEKHSGATGLAYGSENYACKLAEDGSWYGHDLDNRT